MLDTLPENGKRPVSASKSMILTPYQSLAGVEFSPLACSGDI